MLHQIRGVGTISKSRNCNLHLLVHKVFLKFRCENEKTNAIFQVYLMKNGCWNLPFRKTPLFAVATPSDWRRTASSRRFGVYKVRFPPKSVCIHPDCLFVLIGLMATPKKISVCWSGLAFCFHIMLEIRTSCSQLYSIRRIFHRRA